MIPRIIHYCWFGPNEIPQLERDCIASWHTYMPDWEYRLWNEDNFNVNVNPYVAEAYAEKKYAFVADYVRLCALKEYGGLYLDTDVMVFKPFDDILDRHAFAGYEGSKKQPIGTCVMASEPNGEWVSRQLSRYSGRHFILRDGSFDMTTNVTFITSDMIANGLICDGSEKDCMGLHVFPVDFFSPRLTTGEYVMTANTYSDHLGSNSWGSNRGKPLLLRIAGPALSVKLIKLKRKLIG